MSGAPALSPTGRVLSEIDDERQRQDAKWGEQNLPDGTGPEVVWAFAGPAEWVRRSAQATCARMAEEGLCTWLDVLLEEVAEALAEDDPVRLRTELVQVAAVATQWVEALDRRAAGATS